MTEQKKEIRKFLVGYYTRGENGPEVCTGVFNPFLSGFRSSALAAFILGVTCVERQVTVHGNVEKVTDTLRKAFADVGSCFTLKTAPERLCTLVSPLIWNPYVFTVYIDGKGKAVLSCYMVRGVFSYVKGRLWTRKFLRRFDDTWLIETDSAKKRRSKKKVSK